MAATRAKNSRKETIREAFGLDTKCIARVLEAIETKLKQELARKLAKEPDPNEQKALKAATEKELVKQFKSLREAYERSAREAEGAERAVRFRDKLNATLSDHRSLILELEDRAARFERCGPRVSANVFVRQTANHRELAADIKKLNDKLVAVRDRVNEDADLTGKPAQVFLIRATRLLSSYGFTPQQIAQLLRSTRNPLPDKQLKQAAAAIRERLRRDVAEASAFDFEKLGDVVRQRREKRRLPDPT